MKARILQSLDLYKYNLDSLSHSIINDSEKLNRETFKFKLEAYSNFNKIYENSEDYFSNNKYLEMYNQSRFDLKKKIANLDEEMLKTTEENATAFNKELIKTLFDQSLKAMQESTKKLTEVFTKLHNKIMDDYLLRSMGKNRLQIFIEYIRENKKVMFKLLLESLIKQNQIKIKQIEENIDFTIAETEKLAKVNEDIDKDEVNEKVS